MTRSGITPTPCSRSPAPKRSINGILHLKSFASQGFHPTTISTRNSGRTFTRGYFEARMRWTAAEPTVAPPFAITPSSDIERRPSREAGLEAR
jgi:hypothetical protein